MTTNIALDISAATATVTRSTYELDISAEMPSIDIGIPGPAGPGNPMLVMTAAEYAALPVKDPATVYVVI